MSINYSTSTNPTIVARREAAEELGSSITGINGAVGALSTHVAAIGEEALTAHFDRLDASLITDLEAFWSSNQAVMTLLETVGNFTERQKIKAEGDYAVERINEYRASLRTFMRMLLDGQDASESWKASRPGTPMPDITALGDL